MGPRSQWFSRRHLDLDYAESAISTDFSGLQYSLQQQPHSYSACASCIHFQDAILRTFCYGSHGRTQRRFCISSWCQRRSRGFRQRRYRWWDSNTSLPNNHSRARLLPWRQLSARDCLDPNVRPVEAIQIAKRGVLTSLPVSTSREAKARQLQVDANHGEQPLRVNKRSI